MIEIRGKIARQLKFWGQLGVKLTQFTFKDHSATGGQLWGFNWQNQEQTRKKIKVLGSIIGVIKSNWKIENWNELWPKTELNIVHYLLHFFQKRLVQLPILQVHLIHLTSTKFNQTWTKMILCSSSTALCQYFSVNDNPCWNRPKHANSGSLQLQIWQFDSAPCLFWANGWDHSQQNQGLKFFSL